MRVGYYLADQNPQRDRTLGISTYTGALMREMQNRPEVTITVLQSKSSLDAPDALTGRRILPFRTDHSIGRLLADQVHPLLGNLEVDLWHYPKGFLPFALRSRRPLVGTICDVILQYYADHYPRARSALAYSYWLGMLKRSIERLDLVLTISEFSRQQIIAFARRYQIRCPEILVTYLGCDWEEPPELAKENVVVHLASKEPHKGTKRLLEFWQTLESATIPECKLELIGNLAASDRAVAEKLSSVRLSDRLPYDGLRERLARARALILPSEIEGFGLPALESYRSLTPVVYVRNTAVEEILGQGTTGAFELDSFDSFRKALEEVLGTDKTSIETKRRELEGRFSWKGCVDGTIEAYNSLLSS